MLSSLGECPAVLAGFRDTCATNGSKRLRVRQMGGPLVASENCAGVLPAEPDFLTSLAVLLLAGRCPQCAGECLW